MSSVRKTSAKIVKMRDMIISLALSSAGREETTTGAT
jgi:hypothetical protein